jgi:hypothetical protein
LEGIIAAERAKKQQEYVANWDNVPTDLRLPMPIENYLLALGTKSGTTNKLVGSGLNVTIGGAKQVYDSFDLDFRKQSHQDWTILYDAQDQSQVLAVSADTKHRFVLERKFVQAMAIDDRGEHDAKELKRVKDYNQKAISYITESREENAAVLEVLFDNPLLNDTLAKHLLVDSRGQHKDQKSKQRLAAAQVEKALLKQEKSEKKQAEKTWQEEQNAYINKKIDINQYL